MRKYFDTARQVKRCPIKVANDGKLRTKTTGDQLGRAIKHETSEDGSTYAISSESAYRADGQDHIYFQPEVHRCRR